MKTFIDREFEILENSFTNPDDRPIVLDYKNEIIEISKKFEESGQSGASAPYVASIISQSIKKLLLYEPISPLTGEDDEWTDITEMNNGETLYQNKRCSGVFKNGKNGQAYFNDALIKREENGSCWSGGLWINRLDYEYERHENRLKSRGVIKSFPFTPKTFYVDVITDEISEDNFESFLKDHDQLDEFFNYYSSDGFEKIDGEWVKK